MGRWKSSVTNYKELDKPPELCPKCSGSCFIYHEDGWQCFNCMKIIYRYQPPPYSAQDQDSP